MNRIPLINQLITACTILILLGCTQEEPPPTQVRDSELVPLSTLRPTATATIPNSPTSEPTITDHPTATPPATSTTVPTQTPSPSSTPTPPPPQGTLLIAGEGFLQVSLESGEQSFLLEYQADWLSWRASFSPGNEQVVYWVKTDEASELWTTPLSAWAPERLLYLPGTDYVNVQYYWLNTDRHLFVQFFVINDTTTLEVPVASYIIDLSEKTVLSRPGWYGICTVMAVSPRTNHLSTWCPMENEPSGQSPFLVIELDESVWISEDAPQIVLTERENWADWNQMWIWSGDGRYVAYTIIGLVDGYVTSILYYSRTDRNEPVILSDGRSKTLSLYSLSREGQYITYHGICQNGIGCVLVMQVATQNVVWTSQMVDPSTLGSDLYWSPDSRFFAANGFQEIVIVDITTQEVVLEFDNVPGAEAMVWLED